MIGQGVGLDEAVEVAALWMVKSEIAQISALIDGLAAKRPEWSADLAIHATRVARLDSRIDRHLAMIRADRHEAG